MQHVIEVRINCPTRRLAEQIADAALTARVAASANLHAAVDSRYRWQGGVEAVRETPLVLKTRSGQFDALAELVRALHPYQVPSIVATRLHRVDAAYRDWVLQETRSQ